MFIVALHLLSCAAMAQGEKGYEVIDTRSGLPHPKVSSITQDGQGFMWFGTQSGLVRYDGNNYVNFSVNGEHKGLSSNHVNVLLHDPSGYLWIGTEDGLDRLDLRTYTFERIRFERSAIHAAWQNQYISSIYRTRTGSIWVGTRNAFLYKYSEGSCRLYFSADKAKFGTFPMVIGGNSRRDGTLWIQSARDQVGRMDTASGKIIETLTVPGGFYGMIWSKRYGQVVSGRYGLSLPDGKGDLSPLPLGRPVEKTYVALMDANDHIWVAEDANRVLRYDGKELKAYDFIFSAFPAKSYHIDCFFEDRLHTLWIGTSRGIVKFHIPGTQFTHYLQNQDGRLNSIRSIAGLKNGTLFFGGYDFLYQLNGPGGTPSEPVKAKCTPYTITSENDSMLWMSTEGNGFRRYDIRGRRFVDYPVWKERGAKQTFAFQLAHFKRSDGKFWLSTYDNILLFDPATGRMDECNLKFDGIVIGHLKGLQFYQTRDRHLWIATNMGLFELDTASRPVHRYSEKGKAGSTLSNNYVNNIHEDRNGRIWIATATGLNRLDRGTGHIAVYTKEHGLADNMAVSILSDRRDRIWVATNNGLSVLNTKTQQFRNYYSEDGLTSNEFNHGAFYRAPSGMMYFGTINGINSFMPDSFGEERTTCPLLVTDIEVSNEGSAVRSEPPGQSADDISIELPNNNRFCRIQFSLTDYTRPQSNIYAYMLEGVDRSWVNIGNQSYVRLTALPPGQYRLLIKAAGSNGIWSDEPVRLLINVAGPFYSKWWFIAMMVLLSAAVLYAIVRFRIEQYKRLANMRIKIASDLHDEVGSVLTRVAMQAELVSLEAEEERPMLLASIIESCRTAMSNMRDVVWSIDARNDKLANLIDRMNGHIIRMTDSSRFAYSFDYDESIAREPINPNDRQNIYLIFKEAVNNIMKHSNGNEISIRFYRDQEALHMVISDNGTEGEPVDGDGSGIRNMQMRADRIGADLKVERTLKGFVVNLRKRIKK